MGPLRLSFSRIPYPMVCYGSYSFMKTILQDIIEQTCEEIVDENLLSTLGEMTRDKQYDWLVDGAFAMFTTILSQRAYDIRNVL